MGKAEDRRRRIRVPVEQKIRHSRYQVLGTPVYEENSALDLSSNGISFATAKEYRRGDLIILEVVLDGEPLKLLVCIAWVKKEKDIADKYQVGAELIAIDPEHKKQMQGHLSKLIQKFSEKKPKLGKKISSKKAKAKKKTKKKISKKPAKKTPKKPAKKSTQKKSKKKISKK
jgi:hypothetical protein